MGRHDDVGGEAGRWWRHQVVLPSERARAVPVTDAELAEVFRTPAGIRLFWLLFALVIALTLPLHIFQVIRDDSIKTGWDKVGAWLTIPAAFLAAWLLAFRPRVAFDGDDLLIVNWILSYRIPLRDIDARSVTATRSGIFIAYVQDGRVRRVTAWAVQASIAGRWLKLNRPQQLAGLIARAATQAPARRSPSL